MAEAWPKSKHINDGFSKYGPSTLMPRDLMGYGGNPPSNFKWPKGAKVALNFCIHYEAGGEECELHGNDDETKRHVAWETMCDYGARAGFWRLHRLFTRRKIPVTVFAVGMALERNPMVAHALREEQNNNNNNNSSHHWEVASAGYRSMDYSNKESNTDDSNDNDDNDKSTKKQKKKRHEIDEATEREQLERCIKIHERLLGKRPVGIYYSPGQVPSLSSRQYIVQHGGFKYDSDSYADDLPYWTMNYGSSSNGNGNSNGDQQSPCKPHLIIPYSIDCSDVQGGKTHGAAAFATGAEMSLYLKDTLRLCVEEGRAGAPKVMTVGLHCRLATPGRINGLVDFIDFAKSYGTKDVWICTREDIADYWSDEHYPKGIGKPIAEEPHTLPAGAVVDLMPTTTTTTMPDLARTTTEASNGEPAVTNETKDTTTISAANE